MVLGITGKSGAGKHTAAEFLRQKGWVILDADRIAHFLYRPYTHVWKAVTKKFGEDILGSADIIDRQKLGRIVFDESPKGKKALEDLNAILHPAIRHYFTKELHFLRRKEKTMVAVVAALWEETGLPEFCEKILLITSNEAVAFERIRKRDGINEAAYRSRISRQSVPPRADFIVENNGAFADFYQALNILKIGEKA
ncbi:dephospho-CoA kinase [Candidatus Peregrinibacteria bacterium]|nr:dephospho-CoA kinase [Candidatus Peregrinibacteria bacterium]